ncbi:hypothetical protein YN1_5970 [Nanoarchaeota archaeon]
MNKEKIINLLVIIIILGIILYIIFRNISNNQNQFYYYKNPDNITIVSPYSIQQLSFIPIEPNISLYNMEKNYKYFLLIYDPTLSGYYNAEIAYIYIKIPYLVPVCSYYYPSPGCKYFLENNSITSNYIFVYSSSNYTYNYTYILPANETLLVFIKPTKNKYGIYIDNNSIYIENNNSILAEEIAAKFILYWYGIINN